MEMGEKATPGYSPPYLILPYLILTISFPRAVARCALALLMNALMLPRAESQLL